jgi:hypothetical protein
MTDLPVRQRPANILAQERVLMSGLIRPQHPLQMLLIFLSTLES